MFPVSVNQLSIRVLLGKQALTIYVSGLAPQVVYIAV